MLIRLVVGFLLWVLIIAYYLLVDGERLGKWVRSSLPLPDKQLAFLGRRFTDMASALLLGEGLTGVIQGTTGGVVFALLDLPAPVMWGVVMAIIAFFPLIGISFVYLPAAAILLLAGDTTRAVLMLAPLVTVATVMEYRVKPILVGRRAQMHPIVVALSLLGGFEAFGVMGLLLGPLAMMLLVSLVEISRTLPHTAGLAG